jgi:hypothetical protein
MPFGARSDTVRAFANIYGDLGQGQEAVDLDEKILEVRRNTRKVFFAMTFPLALLVMTLGSLRGSHR